MVKFITLPEVAYKQLYVTDPSKHKFLVSLANSPSTFSSIINSIISLLLKFGSKQTTSSNTNTIIKNEKQTIIEVANTSNSNVELNISSDTIADVVMSDFEHLSMGEVYHE